MSLSPHTHPTSYVLTTILTEYISRDGVITILHQVCILGLSYRLRTGHTRQHIRVPIFNYLPQLDPRRIPECTK